MNRIQVDEKFLNTVKKVNEYLYKDEFHHYCESHPSEEHITGKETIRIADIISEEHIFYSINFIDNELKKLEQNPIKKTNQP